MLKMTLLRNGIFSIVSIGQDILTLSSFDDDTFLYATIEFITLRNEALKIIKETVEGRER